MRWLCRTMRSRKRTRTSSTMMTSTIQTPLHKRFETKCPEVCNLPPARAAFFVTGENPEKWRLIWHFSHLQSTLYRPSLSLSALALAYGVWSICWRATARITRAPMLMCGKVTHKNLIDSLHYSEKLTKKKQN